MRSFGDVSTILFAAFLFLVGCSNALNYEVAKLTDQQRTHVRQTLTADQSKKLDDWIARNTVAGKDLPPRVTVGQALKDQADWLTIQKLKEAKSDALRKMSQARRAADQEKLLNMLSLALVSKKNRVQEDERRVVALEIACNNKTDKEIQGVKGVIKLTDIYGDAIIDIGWSYDRGISAKGTAIDHEVGIPISKSMEPQIRLWNTDFERLKSTFELSSIIFKDGTTASAVE